MPDPKCPYVRLMGEDLTRVPTADWKCTARDQFEYGEYGGSFDYHNCNSDNHPTCQYFLAAREKLTKAPPAR